ncbi:MAG: response regulator [Desulfobacterales bacterium]|nr:response regulator [Desulfobacterales bacterium]
MKNNRPVRVLYIAENEGERRLPGESTELGSCVVDLARNGAEGLSMYKNAPHDVVVVDQDTTDFDGLAAVRSLDRAGSRPALIVVSGARDERVAVEALALGAEKYIIKEPGEEGLQWGAVIDKALRKRRLTGEKPWDGKTPGEAPGENEKYKKLFEEAKRAEMLYRSLLRSSADAIVIYDLDENPTYVSPAFTRVFGWPREEFKGQWNWFIPESERAATRSILTRTIENGVPCHDYETKRRHRDGFMVDVSLSASRYDDHEGRPAGVLVIYRDISEKKRLEVKLQHSERLEAIGTLAGGIAHDFNNILSSVIGYTELALDDVEEGTLLESNLEEVLIAGNRARELVQQILAFSRQTDQEQKPVQVKLLVKEALKLLRASLPATIEIRQHIQSDALVMADPTQINQVIMNMCTNAGHAMQIKGGVMEVSLSSEELTPEFTSRRMNIKPGKFLKLVVKDSGHGMSATVMSRIFDPFFTTKPQGEGTGLGLSMVHGIISGLGGLITPYSEPGKGSRFEIYMPVIETEASPKITAQKVLPSGAEHILFVDDEPPIVKMGKQSLERLGYHVETRTSSLEALELFKAKPRRFDLVITDMTMPNMTGEDLSLEMLEIRPDIPIILCTGFSNIITEERAKKVGIKAFVTKPILMREIAETIRNVLDV